MTPRLLPIVALAAFAAWPVVRAQAPIFSSSVSTVRLDVSVHQGQRAVTHLTAGDFEVIDNGVRQQVTFASLEQAPVRVVLALDVSGSVQGARLTALQAAGERLVDMLSPGETAAVIAFTDLVTIASSFTSDKARLHAALQRPDGDGDTALVDAAHAALVLGHAQEGRPLVIIFSDGTDTASFLPPDLVLGTARRTSPVVYAVTVRDTSDRFLNDLVALTGGRRLEVESFDRLSDAFTGILAESRTRYLLSYTPTGVPADGWHKVTVRVRGLRADVRARPGYLAGSEK